jgi:hypothetical protein
VPLPPAAGVFLFLEEIMATDDKDVKLYEVKLSYKELMGINFQLNDEAEAVRDKAIQEDSIGLPVPIMNEAIIYSLNKGIFSVTNKRICYCQLCETHAGYVLYSRTGRYARKGQPNYDKPKHLPGIKLNEGFVSIKGHGDFCQACNTKHNIVDTIKNYIIDNDLKIEIIRDDRSLWKKDDIRICFECEAEIQESEMGLLPAMMSGHYRGECPKCGAKQLPFGKSHKHAHKFKMIKRK